MTAYAPLSARSVVLSLILGTPSRALTAAQLADAARHVGINPATVRVALTRAVASHELVRDGSLYRLGPRLVERRERQDAHASVTAWDGTWEMVVVVASGGRSSSDRAALRAALSRARLAELREGVWMRPANLRRETPAGSSVDVRTFSTTSDDPAGLVADLWDLPGWAAETRRVVTALEHTRQPGERLAVAAHLVRHLSDDPLLPAELAPADWPADEARAAYGSYLAELEDVVSGARTRRRPA